MSNRTFKAFTLGKEIDFHAGGKDACQVWGGGELLWEKNRIKIRRNIANFCGFSKCVSENGAELLAVCYERDSTDTNEGIYLELFTGNSPYSKRLIECQNESWRALSYGKYFYVIKYKRISYAAGKYVITSFYKFDENGNVIYHFENSEMVPTDSLESITIHEHSHFLCDLRDFYIVDDTFYIIFKIASNQITNENDTGLFFIIGYQNGTHTSQKIVLNAEPNALANPSPCTYQFVINNSTILTGVNIGGATYDERPLENVSDDTLKALTSQGYSFLGTDGKKIYLTDIREGTAKRRKIYLYENGKCTLKKNMNDDKEYMSHQFLTATFIGDTMYAVMTHGGDPFPSNAIVVKIDTKTFEKSKIIYKLNTPTRKYRWATIRQITSKNGKIYVHKEYQKLWTDNTFTLEIDEITLPQ